MNKVCNHCTHQEADEHGGVRCGEASFTTNNGYGNFKQGARCIFDDDLEALFTSRTGKEVSIHDLSEQIKSQKRMLVAARIRIDDLENLLLRLP